MVDEYTPDDPADDEKCIDEKCIKKAEREAEQKADKNCKRHTADMLESSYVQTYSLDF